LRPFQDVLGPERLVVALLGSAIVLQLLRSSLQFGSETLGAALQADVTETTRSRLLRHLLALDYQEFSRHKLGRLQNHFEQTTHIGVLLGYGSKLITQLAIAAAYLAVLMGISGTMRLTAVGVMAVLSWPVRVVLRRVNRAGGDYVAETAAANEQTTECLQGFRPLHAFGLVEHALDRSEEKFHASGQAL